VIRLRARRPPGLRSGPTRSWPRLRRDRQVQTNGAGGAHLVVDGLVAGYGTAVLHGVSLEVGAGEIITLLGANGAGKSTLAKAIVGMITPRAGSIRLDGEDITGMKPGALARRGVAIVPEGRRVFARRTVVDNLLVAAWVRRHEAGAVRSDVEELLERFPILGTRRRDFAGSLSGGEAQLLAIAMALVARPRLVILDEPSLGLSPIAVGRMAGEVMGLGASGTSVLLIEQNARTALRVAARGYVLELGRIEVSGTSDELRADDAVQAAYLRM
jgi:branched-chain amino acid transport system ATP-binding protein